MEVALISSPLGQIIARQQLYRTMSVNEILDFYGAPPEFRACGQVILHAPPKNKFLPSYKAKDVLDGEIIPPHQPIHKEGYYTSTVIPRDMWTYVKIKPDAVGVLELCPVPQKSSTLLSVVGALAVAALTAFTAGGGLVTLGFSSSLFGAGTLGAAVASAGVGTLGALALSMLTPPPPGVSSPGEQGKTDSSANISQNTIARFASLPVVFGKVRIAPPLLSRAYTTYENNELWIHAIVGVQGRCAISDILINGNGYAEIDRLQIQTSEGNPSNPENPTIAFRSVVTQSDNVVLSNFRTKLESTKNDQVDDQINPNNSLPGYHTFTTDGAVDEVNIRLLFPGGISYSGALDSDDVANVAIRLEARRKGTTNWRNFPTMHIRDARNGAGVMRTNIQILWQKPPAGYFISHAYGEWPIYSLNAVTGISKSFLYSADSYFIEPTGNTNSFLYFGSQTGIVNPLMSGATTSGCTMSSSSNIGGNEAWRACNNDVNEYWRPADNSLPAWIQWQFTTPQTVKSYLIDTVSFISTNDMPTNSPVTFYMEASNNGVDWTRIQTTDIDISNYGLARGVYHCDAPDSYLFYRLKVLTNNGAANQEVRIYQTVLFAFDAPGISLTVQPPDGNNKGFPARSADDTIRCMYGSLSEDGVVFYLDPAQWPQDQYEFRLKRSVAFQELDFKPYEYAYSNSSDNGDFFDYRLSSGKYVIRVGQKKYRSDCQIESFQSIAYSDPIDMKGISWIAIRAPNIQVNSISGIFQSYAPIWDGSVWTEEHQLTSNPAALYRFLELGYGNLNPTPGELIDEEAFQDWFTRGVVAGHEVNIAVQDTSIADVKQVLAACGFASVRDTNLVSIAVDYDRSAELPTQAINDVNSKNLGMPILLPDLAHALYVEYQNEDDDYKAAQTIVYREGYTAANATLFEAATYRGFTNTAKVIAKANFDLKQLIYRKTKYIREMGLEALLLYRGKLVALNTPTLDKRMYSGIIKSIQTSGPNYVSVTLDIEVAFQDFGSDISDVDFDSVTDMSSISASPGIAIRLNDGSILTKQLTNVSASKVCTFTTPFTNDGSLMVGQIASVGIFQREYIRAIVHSIIPQDENTFRVVLVDDASEYLF